MSKANNRAAADTFGCRSWPMPSRIFKNLHLQDGYRLAVIPNMTIFKTSASSAYFRAACSRVTSAGMRFALIASV